MSESNQSPVDIFPRVVKSFHLFGYVYLCAGYVAYSLLRKVCTADCAALERSIRHGACFPSGGLHILPDYVWMFCQCEGEDPKAPSNWIFAQEHFRSSRGWVRVTILFVRIQNRFRLMFALVGVKEEILQ